MNKENAKDLLFELKEILDELGIKFFLNYATCLGAYRGDFCEGDGDIDLGVKHEVIVPKMKLLLEALKQHKFEIVLNSFPSLYVRSLYASKNNISANIQDYALNNKHRFHNACGVDYASVHDSSLFENMQTINFLGKKFLVPNQIEKFLEFIYGKTWRIPKLSCDWPKEYGDIIQEYWRTTPYSKLTEMYHKRIDAAWMAYRLELRNTV